jgi:GxxExxY protein
MYKEVTEEEDRIGREIVNAAFQVHKVPGPGLPEKVYEVCFLHILKQKGFDIKRQIDITVVFDWIIFQAGLRLDILINDMVI